MFFFIYLPVFIVALIFWSRFQFGEEGKDERGQKILNRSYRIVFPMFLVGFVVVRLIEDLVMPLDGSDWRAAMWYLITGIMILHSVLIYTFRRQY